LPNDPGRPDEPADPLQANSAEAITRVKAKKSKEPKQSSKAETVAECIAALEGAWAEVMDRADAGNTSDFLENADVLESIRYSLNCQEKAYHYVLITQLTAKIADPKRNCRALQDRARVEAAFDARTIAHNAIVPFERQQFDGVLGRSPSPYLINSVRVPLLDPDDGKNRKDEQGWRRVCRVALEVESRNDRAYTALVFRQVLLEIYRKLGSTAIKYNVPLRVTLAQVVSLIRAFTAEKSGGDRPLALTAALFENIGSYAKLFQPGVRRSRINASDDSARQVADLECLDAEGKIIMAIEVKDKMVAVSDLEEKLGAPRGERTSRKCSSYPLEGARKPKTFRDE
jgi:hypothetical protein